MTPIAQNTRFQEIALWMPNPQRPGRRTFSLTAGVGSILILVDAIFHPGPVTGLWTIQTIQDLSALMLYPIVAIGLAAIAYGLRGRRRTRTSDAVSDSAVSESETAGTMVVPTPIRSCRARLHLVETPDLSSRAA